MVFIITINPPIGGLFIMLEQTYTFIDEKKVLIKLARQEGLEPPLTPLRYYGVEDHSGTGAKPLNI